MIAQCVICCEGFWQRRTSQHALLAPCGCPLYWHLGVEWCHLQSKWHWPSRARGLLSGNCLVTSIARVYCIFWYILYVQRQAWPNIYEISDFLNCSQGMLSIRTAVIMMKPDNFNCIDPDMPIYLHNLKIGGWWHSFNNHFPGQPG